jgi:hypothetical protein
MPKRSRPFPSRPEVLLDGLPGGRAPCPPTAELAGVGAVPGNRVPRTLGPCEGADARARDSVAFEPQGRDRLAASYDPSIALAGKPESVTPDRRPSLVQQQDCGEGHRPREMRNDGDSSRTAPESCVAASEHREVILGASCSERRIADLSGQRPGSRRCLGRRLMAALADVPRR